MKYALVLVLILLSHTAASQELGDEAYGVLTSTFMYDASFPINARRVGNVKREGLILRR
jgi:hypothetical protein